MLLPSGAPCKCTCVEPAFGTLLVPPLDMSVASMAKSEEQCLATEQSSKKLIDILQVPSEGHVLQQAAGSKVDRQGPRHMENIMTELAKAIAAGAGTANFSSCEPRPSTEEPAKTLRPGSDSASSPTSAQTSGQRR